MRSTISTLIQYMSYTKIHITQKINTSQTFKIIMTNQRKCGTTYMSLVNFQTFSATNNSIVSLYQIKRNVRKLTYH